MKISISTVIQVHALNLREVVCIVCDVALDITSCLNRRNKMVSLICCEIRGTGQVQYYKVNTSNVGVSHHINVVLRLLENECW